MLKQTWKILIITAGCATTLMSTAVAQPNVFLGTSPDQNRPIGSGKVLAPADFAKGVSKIGAQQNDAFQRQLNQQLSQVPKAAVAPPTTPVGSSPAPTAPSSFGTQPLQPSNTMQQPGVSSPSSANQFNQQSTTVPNTAPITTSPTPVQRLPSAPTAPVQSQQPVYTGFPANAPPPSQTTQPSGQTKAPSNWNIKY